MQAGQPEDRAMQGCNPSAVLEAGAGLGRLEFPTSLYCRRVEGSAMSNLPQDIGNLSAAEKFELIDALWESIEAEPPALTVEQRHELDAREGRYQQNPSDVRSWEHVKARLLKKQ
jgi:putative addiction module component (TIGR02574 family)